MPESLAIGLPGLATSTTNLFSLSVTPKKEFLCLLKNFEMNFLFAETYRPIEELSMSPGLRLSPPNFNFPSAACVVQKHEIKRRKINWRIRNLVAMVER